ncbi:MAG: MFS transporter [Halobacteriales archaeon]|nr:MFS transporter [Halobacteriales archaeon]
MNKVDRSILKFVVMAHATVHIFELSIPIFVAIWLFEFNTTPAIIGLTVTVGYGLFGLGSLPSGILADHISSKKLILLCLLGMASSFYLLSISSSLITIALALFLWGSAASIYHPTGLSLISRKVKSIGTVYAYHGIAGNIGTAVGPLATLFLLYYFDWRYVAAILATLSLLVAILSSQIKIEDTFSGSLDTKTLASSDTLKQTSHNIKSLLAGVFLLIFVLVVSYGFYYRSILTFLPVVLSILQTDPISFIGFSFNSSDYFYAGILIVGALGQYVAGKISDRFKPELPLLIGYFALALLAFLFLPAVQSGIIIFAIFGIALGFFLFYIQPLQATLIGLHTPEKTRGLSFGITFTGVYGIGALGAAAAGVLLTYSSPLALFTTLAVVMLFASSLIYLIKKSTYPDLLS